MRKILLIGVIFLWLLSTSLTLTYVWFNHPEMFPAFPQPLAVWLASQSSVPKDDLSVLIGLGGSFVFMSLITFIGAKIWQKLQCVGRNK